MMMARLEHLNVTVGDIESTADLLGDLFGWKVRWRGASAYGGHILHVGTKDQYLALYSGPPGEDLMQVADSHGQLGGLNHIGLVVDNLDVIEARVRAAGLTPHSHGDYEPGRRFYFDGKDGVEYEVVSYT
jgi:catechol 2,3-dioxygenase-like lactoylglutathione lyase family enzyme